MTHDDENTLLYQRVSALALRCDYKTGYQILVRRDQKDPDGRVYAQVRCWRPDTFSATYDWGYGGKAYLSPHAVDSEIVATFFGLLKAYEEHECREWFTFDERRVYGPHIDVHALWDAATHIDARPKPERTHDDESDRQDQGSADGEVGTRTGGSADQPVVDLSIPDAWKARSPSLVRDDT